MTRKELQLILDKLNLKEVNEIHTMRHFEKLVNYFVKHSENIEGFSVDGMTFGEFNNQLHKNYGVCFKYMFIDFTPQKAMRALGYEPEALEQFWDENVATYQICGRSWESNTTLKFNYDKYLDRINENF